MKRIFVFLLSLALCLGLAAPVLAAGPTFEDVPASHWAYAQIERAFAENAVSGSHYDPAAGTRLYSPDSTLSLAQFITILTNAFYNGEVATSAASGSWYAKNQAVAQAHSLLDGVRYDSLGDAASRYSMAVLISNVLRDKGADMPDAQERASVVDKISDWNNIPIEYRSYVANVYYLGIIGGVDTAGTFAGDNTMTRAQAAAVYGKVADVLAAAGEKVPTTKPEPALEPEPEPEPEPTPTPSGAAAIGTISDSQVTLSLDTHSVDYIQDYWSEQSTEIKNLTADAKQAFNAAVHSMVNADTMKNQGAFGTSLANQNVNLYYNYAAYKPAYTTKSVVEKSLGYMYFSGSRVLPASSNGLWLASVKPQTKLEPIFEPYLDSIMPGATDNAKARLLVSEVVNYLSYEVSGAGGATWTNGETKGDCENYGVMTAQLLSAAEIPCIFLAYTPANHAWVQAYIDGEWVIIDSTSAESSGKVDSAFYTFAGHASAFGYDNDDVNNSDGYKVTRALIETACKYR